MLEVRAETTLGRFGLDVDFSMGKEVFALLGESGSGKTVTLNLIAGFLTPRSGRVSHDGSVLFDSETAVNLRPEKRRIGYVLQEPYLFPHFNVLGNLLYSRRGRRRRAGPVGEIVDVLDLRALVDRSPRTLSGGEKQRVAIGRALLSSPKILLMDEPVSSLDETSKWRILEYIRAIHRRFGMPILYVTHSMEEVEYLADTIGLMKKGTVLDQGAKGSFLRTERFFATPFGRQFTNLLRGRVSSISPETGMTTVLIGDKTFRFPGSDAEPDATVVVSIPPDKIIVAKDHPRPLSARNIYCGDVEAVFQTESSAVLLLDSGFDLFVEITRDSLLELEITVGDTLHYIVGTHAIRIHTAE